ncbi:TonB-dependent receptor plug domain-containing protein [Mucilaginibacter sp.]|uniref:TonB-dependent receptor plug domain-containing protein n=1 Tax=Mucilaginibacter sp. TaxID=1882438 RepID=UPI00261522F3|nr:TonB-dependent receptor plug domain-containing protein [Mucilaginibacter sp.]MDB4921314.1 hypothetical protein [Mucilaginibacter sp.]
MLKCLICKFSIPGYLLLFICLFPFAVLGQEAVTNKGIVTGNGVNKLKRYLTDHVKEKTYLHFDKSYYAAGDTIYFKAYVTMGERHELSQISGVLHADLINTKNKIDQSILLKITNGVAWGDFTLPDSLPKGEYHVRAYTNWMRNDSEKNFFEQVIPVGSAFDNKVSESGSGRQQPVISKPDLQFFPEGGNLVAGISSKIAFKAVGINGLGLGVKGTVTDNTGKTITQFASVHLGMGYFYLEAEAGKSYKANLSFADGSQDTIDLPKPGEQGIVLTVDNDSLQKASVAIAVNNKYYQQNKDSAYQLLIYSGGIAITVDCKLDSPVIKLDLAKRHLRTGINTLTLFSAAGEPIAERLFFVQNYDQLNLSVSSDKITYATRGKINIRLNAKNRADSAVTGHFSVSVIDESKVPIDENAESTILSNLLLTADLKGNVEQPNYYFNNITDEKLKNLDLVMLTHGYRGFEWKQVLSNTVLPPAYQPEKTLEVSGIVETLGSSPIANGMVSLIPTIGGPVLSEKADDKGNFKFRNLEFLDSTRFVIQAVNAKGKNTTQLVYKQADVPGLSPIHNNNADVNQQLSTYLKNSEDQLNEYNKYGSPKGIMLQEVRVKEIKAKDKYRSSVFGGPGHADQVVHMDDIRTGGDLVDKLNGILRGIDIVKIPGGTFAMFLHQKMLIVVDGVTMDNRYDFNSLGPNDVETVEVLKYGNASIYGMGSGNGVLVFTTRIGNQRDLKDIPSFGILPIIARGYYKARTFYSPKYDNLEANMKRKDLRSTIYWNPELVTDKDGNAEIDYYNADAPGTYRMVVEGIDEKGNLGRKVYRYTVK